MTATRSSDFHMGARVESADGRHVGSLHRLLIDRVTFVVEALVVEETGRFAGTLLAPGAHLLTNDVVVPAAHVASADGEVVRLSIDVAAIRRLQPYLAHHFEPAGSGHDVAGSLEAWVLRPLAVLGGVGVPALTETAAISDADFEVESGARVLSADGEVLGEIEDVLVEDGALVGVVLTRGLFTDQQVIIPRRLLGEGEGGDLVAQLDASDLDHLRPFLPTGG